MSIRFQIAAMAAAALLTGCAALTGGPPKPLDTYELTAPVPSAAGRRLTRRQVLVAEPSALKALDSENIVISTSSTSLQYLEGAQWSDRLPKIVQARLIESYQLSRRLGGVGRPGEGLAVDYQVQIDIRAFEIRVEAGENAYVELSVKVLNDRNGVVRADRVFTASVPVSGSGNDAYVDALNRAFAEAVTSLVDWSLSVM